MNTTIQIHKCEYTTGHGVTIVDDKNSIYLEIPNMNNDKQNILHVLIRPSYEDYKVLELGTKVMKLIKDKNITSVGLDYDKTDLTNLKYRNLFTLSLLINKPDNVTLDIYNYNVDNTLIDLIKWNRDIINTPRNQMDLEELHIKIMDKVVEHNIMYNYVDEHKDDSNVLTLTKKVNRASIDKARLLHLMHIPENPKTKIVFIGKGIHFDTGGYSLKPSDSMITMKADKSGAILAIVLVMLAKHFNLDIEVHAVTIFAENLLHPDGYKPGDVLTSRLGKTIEVTNTDAEGRLVLADALEYVNDNIDEYDEIISLATLTGASVIALGEYTAAIHGNKYTAQDIIDKGDNIEYFAYMKDHPKLKKVIESKIADLKNASGRPEAGSITAYLFLKEFINYPEKYTHIDIAGPAYTEKLFNFTEYGATGFGILTLLDYLISKTSSTLRIS